MCRKFECRKDIHYISLQHSNFLHNIDFHLLTASVNAKYYYRYRSDRQRHRHIDIDIEIDRHIEI